MAKPTVAIYGIKDWANDKYPTFAHDHNLCIMQNGEILQYLQLELALGLLMLQDNVETRNHMLFCRILLWGYMV